MAEPILAAIALPLAIATAIPLCENAVQAIANRVKAYRNPYPIVLEIIDFGPDLSDLRYKLDEEMIQWAASVHISESLRASLERDLARLLKELKKTDNTLIKYLNEDGTVRRWRFAMNAKRKFKKRKRALDSWRQQFMATLSLIEQHRKRAPQTNLLGPSKFAVKPIPAERAVGGELSSTRNVHVVNAEMNLDGKTPKLIQALIEKRESITNADPEYSRRVNSEIARSLSGMGSGLLRCVGYRDTPDLIFVLPRNEDQVQESLRARLTGDLATAAPNSPGRTLNERVNLARQVAGALVSVHATGLFHKNIRSDTILLVQSPPAQATPLDNTQATIEPTREYAVLTHWALARVTKVVTNPHPQHEWQQDIYRHLKHQWIRPDDSYNMGHDIYSMGVCLLEIGLWEPLVVQVNREYKVSNTIVDRAIALGLLSAGSQDRTGRILEPDLLKLVLLDLCTTMLPSRMGALYTEAVRSCLQCVDEGFGNVADLSHVEDVSSKYNTIVMGVLNDIRV